ncbi:hypothetical protein DPMN_088800 [Dreissena polymorpha]|uniref:Uncharacterized protein n=1 Tax=Dreissena polymorpha TaxID=45954 RepID=A0A9D4KVQ8_DREPO|nr:hypothetical protein DPMN_088800 [Dreissena polymorpha]
MLTFLRSLFIRENVNAVSLFDRPGWFCSVAGDMKVEQTIQRVSKAPGGHYVVGETRNAGALAEFELLFHEIGSITSLLNLLTLTSRWITQNVIFSIR